MNWTAFWKTMNTPIENETVCGGPCGAMPVLVIVVTLAILFVFVGFSLLIVERWLRPR